ncbi:MAG: hypothetical protein Q8P02_03450 [Candidatus Micrarchaeota archaeon]|nr:hypothetical protein [Candidatus Micrarchaeota archaeon]
MELVSKHYPHSELVLAVGSDALAPFLRELRRAKDWGLGQNKFSFHVVSRGDEPDFETTGQEMQRQFNEFRPQLDSERQRSVGRLSIDERLAPFCVASSEVRQAIKTGRPFVHLVPKAVHRHIRAHGLYGV